MRDEGRGSPGVAGGESLRHCGAVQWRPVLFQGRPWPCRAGACPCPLQVEVQRSSQGWKHRPPVLPPQSSPCLGAVAAGEDGAGLQAHRFRPGGCPLPALQLPHLCGVVFLTPWVRVTQLTSQLLLLNQGLGEPLREWLQRPT